jgi:hypothetical protein
LSPGVEPVSQTQTQPKPESFFEAPTYTRDELEFKLENLKWKIDYLTRNFHIAWRNLLETHRKLNETRSISDKTVAKFDHLIEELRDIIRDAIDEMIVNELKLDTDIEKYEEHFNVEFRHGEEHQLGVVLLKEGDRVKPVVVWTDYQEIGYYEGEKSE